MRRVLHMIDGRTDRNSLEQLALLAGPADPIVCPGPRPAFAPLAGRMQSIRLPLLSSSRSNSVVFRRLGQVDIVHAWSRSVCPTGEAIARRLHRPMVLSLPYLRGGLGAKIAAWRSRATSLEVTVPTEGTRQQLVEQGLAIETVRVLPPAAGPCDDAVERRWKTRRSLGLSESDCLIVAPAEMIRPAGHRITSWAHAIVRQVFPHVRLMMPGSGPVNRSVRFFAHTTGYDKEIFLTRDRFGSSDALAAADIAAFFYEQDSGLSQLASAMAMGLAIVASRTPDVAQCVPHERAALLAQPGSPRSASLALLRLIEEPSLASRLGETARNRAAKHFHAGAVRKHLQRIYADALSPAAG